MSGQKRRGAALVTALVAVVLISWLAVALHQVSLGAMRRDEARRDAVVAAAAADAGLWGVVRDARRLGLDTLQLAQPPVVVRRAAGSALVDVRAVRTSLTTWHLSATSWFPDTSQRRRTVRRATLAVRLELPDVGGLAALTVRDAVAVTGSGEVIGTDTTTTALFPGCQPGTGVAGVAMPDTTRRGGSGLVRGLPPWLEDPLAGAMSTYDAFGSESWASLVARATVHLAPGAIITPGPVVALAACDSSVATNWGENLGAGPCARYAPVIHARGSMELRGGRGQGILLVDGDLTVAHGARFDGLVIVRDDLRSGPGGGALRGAVLAADTLAVAGDHPDVGDGLRVERAGCVAAGALARLARLGPLTGRAWVPM